MPFTIQSPKCLFMSTINVKWTWNFCCDSSNTVFQANFSVKLKTFFIATMIWTNLLWMILHDDPFPSSYRCRRGRDHMVVGFKTTCTISAYHHLRCEFESHSGEVYSIQQYAIKFVSHPRQVSGFLRVLWFPPPIKLTATI